MEKLCGRCQQVKDVEEFHKRGKSGRQAWCKTCCSERSITYFQENKVAFADRRIKARKSRYDFINKIKSDLKCSMCGEDHIATLQFHHLDRSQKEFGFAEAVSSQYTIERLKEEIKKCTVMCANCHSILHYEERMGMVV